MRYTFMLVLCIAAGGGMAGTLLWFLKRLRLIERARWGDTKEAGSQGARIKSERALKPEE